jgi:protein-disulfide isomerase
MDHEFNPIVSEPTHIGSGHLAILAIHAAFKGKFSEMNDWLFFKAGVNQSSILLVEAGDATGIDARELAAALTHDRYRLLLKRDIHEGIRLGVVGTPSYLINGRVYEGNIPADILKPLLDVDL